MCAAVCVRVGTCVCAGWESRGRRSAKATRAASACESDGEISLEKCFRQPPSLPSAVGHREPAVSGRAVRRGRTSARGAHLEGVFRPPTGGYFQLAPASFDIEDPASRPPLASAETSPLPPLHLRQRPRRLRLSTFHSSAQQQRHHRAPPPSTSSTRPRRYRLVAHGLECMCV